MKPWNRLSMFAIPLMLALLAPGTARASGLISAGGGGAGAADWTTITNFPAACSAGSFVSTLAAVPTCTSNALTATALAADPTDCAANTFANAINASGNLTSGARRCCHVPRPPILARVSGNSVMLNPFRSEA